MVQCLQFSFDWPAPNSIDNTTKLVWSVKLIHLANTTEKVRFEWKIGWWRLIAIYYSCLIRRLVNTASMLWTFFNLTCAGPIYSLHLRRWVGIPSSQLGDFVFRVSTSSTITINAFSNSLTVLSEKIWLKNTLLYLHSGLLSLDSALVSFLFGSLCLVNFLNHIACSLDKGAYNDVVIV